MARETTIPIEVWQAKEAIQTTKAALIRSGRVPRPAPHDCDAIDNLVYVETDGGLGQAWYCGICGDLRQVG